MILTAALKDYLWNTHPFGKRRWFFPLAEWRSKLMVRLCLVQGSGIKLCRKKKKSKKSIFWTLASSREQCGRVPFLASSTMTALQGTPVSYGVSNVTSVLYKWKPSWDLKLNIQWVVSSEMGRFCVRTVTEVQAKAHLSAFSLLMTSTVAPSVPVSPSHCLSSMQRRTLPFAARHFGDLFLIVESCT